jgi:ubiquinone/menaquinone biosynthesis C-methylase UbiE
MLLQGGKMARGEGLKTLMFLRGDIHQLPFDEESVDRVNCGGALHLFPDLTPILREVSRVLKPGGVFTGMTIALAGGVIGKMQGWVMGRGRPTFFRPDQLAIDLGAVGLSSFKYLQHRVSLVFCAIKDPAGMGVQGA